MKLKTVWSLVIIWNLGFGIWNLCSAVNTAHWEVNTKQDISKGEFQETVLTPSGEVVLGKKPSKIASANDVALWSTVMDKKGNSYFGAGNGKIYKLVDDTKLDEFFSTTETLVTALAINDKGELFAGTIPNGRIYKIDREGKDALFCSLPMAYVWSLAYKDDFLYAATGPVATIYKIDSTGKSEVFYEAKKGQHILCMYLDDYGMYFGTSYPGILYRYNMSDKKAEILYDFGDTEIKTLAVATNSIYLGVNSAVRIMPQDFLNAVKGAAEETKKADAAGAPPAVITAPPPPPKEKPPVQSSIYSITAGNKVRELIRFDRAYITDLKFTSDNYLLAATDNSGKLYQVNPDGVFAIPYDLEASNILALLSDKEGEMKAAATGGAGAVYLFPAGPSEKGVYLSDVLDARFTAEWGALKWEGVGDISFAARSGNTNKPGDTWSDWSEEQVAPQAKLKAPAGRYLQVRATLKGKDAKLARFSVAHRVTNQKPVLMDVRVENAKQAPPPQPQPQPAAVTNLPVVSERTILKKVIYQASDTDGDPLGYRIYYRKEQMTNWILLNQNDLVLTPDYVWNTESVDDGRYLVKVEVTDEKNNPRETALTDEKVARPVLVDNTKPQVKTLKLDIRDDKLSAEGTVVDNFSYIARIEYSVDGKPWQVVYPKDGLFDSDTEDFTVQMSELGKGGHTLLLRAYDASGNLGTRQEEFQTK
ncbi:MAG: hypothetical protein HY762_07795 [Planctomycetes bacterium]|nr:hypothetical protein [Planctomycetota bacterium]